MSTSNVRRKSFSVMQLKTALTLLALPLAAGCGANVWIEETKVVNVPATELTDLSVSSHNGDIIVNGSPTATEVHATIVARYGGWNQASAESCKNAVEIVSEADGPNGHRFYSRWKGVRQSDWQASVTYRVEVPERLAPQLTSHNGDIQVRGVKGNARLLTHNGDVVVNSGSSTLDVVTHNGDIEASAPAKTMNLASHNGDIHFDTTGATALEGRVESHNGGITAVMSENASAELACRTHNGRIKLGFPLTVTSISSREAIGKMGDGSTRLEIETYNGNISLTR